jgi:glutathione S-transferase
MSTRDNGGSGFASLRDAYLASDPNFFTGRVSVPVLWDKVKRTIVNNESLDIIHMLNHEFASVGASVRFDLYSIPLQTKIDALNDRTNRFLAAGVYNVADAEHQAAYDSATGQLFDFLDELEQMVSEGGPFLLGSTITIADVLAFTALVRFDPVYAPLFRIGGKRLSDYTALTAFVSRVYDIPGIAETVRFDHILAHYFDSDRLVHSISPGHRPQPNRDVMVQTSGALRPQSMTAVGPICALTRCTGFDEFRWTRPVYPDDALHLETEVVEVRPSKSNPDQGLAKVRITTLNQRMEPVQVLLANLIVPCRPSDTTMKS